MTELRSQEVQASRSPQHSSPWPWVLLVLVLTPLVVLGVMAVTALGGIAATRQTVDNLVSGRLVVKPDPTSVITEVQQLGRLETINYSVEKVIEGGQTGQNAVRDFLLGDRLLFIARGQVLAGVDLTQLRPEDVTVSSDGQAVTLRLPAAELLSHRLDNEQSRVYDRRTGLLTRGDPELETRVRQEAERQIVLAACQDGILAHANQAAEAQVRTLLQLTRFKQVQFLPARGTGPTGCE